MFSKSLFKQSCKANGIMWIIISFAVCFMLACVMLIAGSGNIADTKVAIENTIIKGELEANTEYRAINYYEIADGAISVFDEKYSNAFFNDYQVKKGQGKTDQEIAGEAVQVALGYLKDIYLPALYFNLGYDAESIDAQEIQGVIFYTLNIKGVDENIDNFYAYYEPETALNYNSVFARFNTPTYYLSEEHIKERKDFIFNNSPIFLSGQMIQPSNIQTVLEHLSGYGVTEQEYADFGFTDYSHVRDIAVSTLLNYRATLDYRLDNLKEGETIESVKQELTDKFSKSLLSTLPKDVSDALDEIGSSDLYGVLVGSIFFKMAGLLLPIIYVIMSSNALIAGQVDSGSMAYVLSTGVKRNQVSLTQAVYLIGSILLMFILTTITSIVCFSIVNVETDLTIGKLLLINLGAFLVMFAMSGICFFASCFFNRSKHSMALGGGLNMFFLVATMLGLFGSSVLPKIIRMDALNAFNYVSIISFFDVVSILREETAFIWKLAILLVIGVIGFIAGARKFDKKDLPL